MRSETAQSKELKEEACDRQRIPLAVYCVIRHIRTAE